MRSEVRREESRAPALTLRPAAETDREFLWEWANDPVARAWSFHPGPIGWEEHLDWFRRKREDPNSAIYIAEEDGQPVAVAGFVIEGAQAIVSINVASRRRGRGIGASVLRLACSRLVEERGPLSVVALIKRGNAASERAFARAGFKNDTAFDTGRDDAFAMRWTSEDVKAASMTQ